jgi:catechol 2,3-dioxygenase-like lactoylglutathione lyase family enzyme
MTLNHMHLQVRDLDAAIDWFETILQVHPGFRNDRMATFSFNSLILVFDAANDDAQANSGI